MAARVWRARFRARVAEADARCRVIPMKIIHARAMLAEPLHGVLVGRVATIRIAEQSAADAAGDLFVAASLLGGATELALRGVAAEVLLPCNPPRGVRLLPRTVAAQRQACQKLLVARVLAAEAYDDVELCCDHLLGIRRLLELDHLHLPGAEELIDAERRRTHALLGKVRRTADDCVLLLAGALQHVAG